MACVQIKGTRQEVVEMLQLFDLMDTKGFCKFDNYVEVEPNTKDIQMSLILVLDGREVIIMARIGVENSLTDVQQALQQQGHEVVTLNSEQDAQGCDCCIVTGQDSNVMGIADTSIKGSVITAHGLTTDEICQQVESRTLGPLLKGVLFLYSPNGKVTYTG